MITNEKEAFDCLRDLLGKPFNRMDFQSAKPGVLGFITEGSTRHTEKFVNVKFKNWPQFEMHIKGENYNCSVPTSVMSPILDLQQEIHKIYCHMVYGHQDVDVLTEKERDLLEIVIRIKGGSTTFIGDLATIGNSILKKGINRMTPVQVTITIITIACLITGSYAWKQYLNSQTAMHQSKLPLRMSEQETKRMEILTSVLTAQSELQAISNSIDDIRKHFLSCLKPEDELSISGELLVSGEKAVQLDNDKSDQFDMGM